MLRYGSAAMRLRHALALALMLVAPAHAQSCRLCAQPGPAGREAAGPDRPLRIEVTAGLDFSRAAAGRSGGEIRVAPGGSRQVAGGLTDLGGLALAGAVVVTGEPGRAIRIDIPPSIEVSDVQGGRARIDGIVTDLSPAPRLDAAGQLRFRFGGRLVLRGPGGGMFRGTIPITAEYQ